MLSYKIFSEIIKKTEEGLIGLQNFCGFMTETEASIKLTNRMLAKS